MIPKKEGQKTVFVCPKCGFKLKDVSEQRMADTIQQKEKKNVEVVDAEIEHLPVTKEECPKCGNDEAYYWSLQTRAADEPETRFFKCSRCKHTWRDYS